MRWMACTLVAMMMATLVGCGGSFTRQNYETVYTGQDARNVKKALGKPHVTFSDQWIYQHKNPFYKAIITFSDSKVVGKSWTQDQQGISSPVAPTTQPKAKARKSQSSGVTSLPAVLAP